MRTTITMSILLLALGATVAAAQTGSPSAEQLGQQILEQHCATCHAASTIMVAAPKMHNQAQWTRRLEASFTSVAGERCRQTAK